MARALAAVVSVFLVLCGTSEVVEVATRATTTERAEFRGLERVVVDDASDITVTGAAAGAPLRVTARVTRGLRDIEYEVRRDGRSLYLDSDCPVLLGGPCEVDYEIAVPPGVGVRASASDGDVRARDLRSDFPVVLESSAGEVSAERVEAPVVGADSSAGDVRLTAIRADSIGAHSSAGDVHVEALDPFRQLRARSSAGDVSVVVPDELYRLDADSSAGDTVVGDVRTDPGARRSLTIRSSAGDVRADVR